jgi:splicing factor 3B subunit 2
LIGILQPLQNQQLGEPVEKALWGELEILEDESEEEEEDEEESEEEDEEDVGAGLQTPGGMETPGGLHSTMPSEFGGTESEFTLRKRKRGTETEEAAPPRSAYQVLPEQAVHTQGFFGSEKVYDLKAAQRQPTLDQDG